MDRNGATCSCGAEARHFVDADKDEVGYCTQCYQAFCFVVDRRRKEHADREFAARHERGAVAEEKTADAAKRIADALENIGELILRKF